MSRSIITLAALTFSLSASPCVAQERSAPPPPAEQQSTPAYEPPTLGADITIMGGAVFHGVDAGRQYLFWFHGRLDATIAAPLGIVEDTGAALYLGYGGTVEANGVEIEHHHGVSLGIRRGDFVTHATVHASFLSAFDGAQLYGVGLDCSIGVALGPFVVGLVVGYDFYFLRGGGVLAPLTLGLTIGFTTT